MEVKLLEKNGYLYVFTPYQPGFTNNMKRIAARWDKNERCWVTPDVNRESVLMALQNWFPGVRIETGEFSSSVSENSLSSIVDRLCSDKDVLYGGDTYERLIAFAYQKGREDATREVSDAYKKKIGKMRERAEKSRYKAIINDAIGDKDYIAFEEYGRKITKEMGELKSELFGKED